MVPPRPPIWLMRQAGRYLPEYRATRRQAGSFLDLCYTPDLATEVTLQPIRRFGLDAAILFSDILVVPDGLGARLTFVEGRGPVLEPLQDRAGLAALSLARMRDHLQPVYRAARQVTAALPPDTPLIGFAGAPWTVAAYMVEGEGSREFLKPRQLALTEPDLFQELIDLLVAASIEHLSAQVDAGAAAVQLFDSWAGVLPEPQFVRWCVQPVVRIAGEIRRRHPEVPIITFPRGAGVNYRLLAHEPAIDGLSLDTTVPLAWARSDLSGHVCLQGNLDPVALLAGRSATLAEAGRILGLMAGRPFIFNLGHGVTPATDPEVVGALVEHVQDQARDGAA